MLYYFASLLAAAAAVGDPLDPQEPLHVVQRTEPGTDAHDPDALLLLGIGSARHCYGEPVRRPVKQALEHMFVPANEQLPVREVPVIDYTTTYGCVHTAHVLVEEKVLRWEHSSSPLLLYTPLLVGPLDWAQEPMEPTVDYDAIAASSCVQPRMVQSDG
jgi:hypothetical protein